MKTKIVVLIAALGFLAFTVIPLSSVIRSNRLMAHGVPAEGTVTDIRRGTARGSTLKRITVTFSTSDGKSVTAEGMKRHQVSIGDKVKLWYDKSDPAKVDFGDTVSYNMRGVVIAGLVFIFLFYYFIRYARKDSVIKRLKASGKKVAAEFISIERDEKFRMGDKNPWQIKCRWTESITGKDYYFLSTDYTIDPAPYLKGRLTVDVYFDPENPAKYFMDTSFMPKGNNTIG
jgi:hypothetical protein